MNRFNNVIKILAISAIVMHHPIHCMEDNEFLENSTPTIVNQNQFVNKASDSNSKIYKFIKKYKKSMAALLGVTFVGSAMGFGALASVDTSIPIQFIDLLYAQVSAFGLANTHIAFSSLIPLGLAVPFKIIANTVEPSDLKFRLSFILAFTGLLGLQNKAFDFINLYMGKLPVEKRLKTLEEKLKILEELLRKSIENQHTLITITNSKFQDVVSALHKKANVNPEYTSATANPELVTLYEQIGKKMPIAENFNIIDLRTSRDLVDSPSSEPSSSSSSQDDGIDPKNMVQQRFGRPSVPATINPLETTDTQLQSIVGLRIDNPLEADPEAQTDGSFFNPTDSSK